MFTMYRPPPNILISSLSADANPATIPSLPIPHSLAIIYSPLDPQMDSAALLLRVFSDVQVVVRPASEVWAALDELEVPVAFSSVHFGLNTTHTLLR